MFVGVSLAQTSKTSEIKVGRMQSSRKHSGMTLEAKRQFLVGITAALERSGKFDVADGRWTRNESQNNLAALNGSFSTTMTAVKN